MISGLPADRDGCSTDPPWNRTPVATGGGPTPRSHARERGPADLTDEADQKEVRMGVVSKRFDQPSRGIVGDSGKGTEAGEKDPRMRHDPHCYR